MTSAFISASSGPLATPTPLQMKRLRGFDGVLDHLQRVRPHCRSRLGSRSAAKCMIAVNNRGSIKSPRLGRPAESGKPSPVAVDSFEGRSEGAHMKYEEGIASSTRLSFSDSKSEEFETREVQESLKIDAPDHWLYALASFMVRSRPNEAHKSEAERVLDELVTADMTAEIDRRLASSEWMAHGEERNGQKFAHDCRRSLIRTIVFRGGKLPDGNPKEVLARRKKLGAMVRKVVSQLESEPHMRYVRISSLAEMSGSHHFDPQITGVLATLAENLMAGAPLTSMDFSTESLDDPSRPFQIPQPGRKGASRIMLERALAYEFSVATGSDCRDLIAMIIDDIVDPDGSHISSGHSVGARLRASKKRPG
jgi:hypothetical protein